MLPGAEVCYGKHAMDGKARHSQLHSDNKFHIHNTFVTCWADFHLLKWLIPHMYLQMKLPECCLTFQAFKRNEIILQIMV